VLALVLSLALILPAHAHQSKELGNYILEVGFAVEPAFQDQMNGVELFVETQDGKKVEGLESSLQVEATAGGKTRKIEIHPVWEDPGHYVGEFMPTMAGDYVFHLTGKIEDMPVDEKFESGPGRFGAVEPLQAAQFPEQLPTPNDLSAMVQAAEARAMQAQTFGLIGMATGILGMVIAGVALFRRRA
jgi:hypothetical protein